MASDLVDTYGSSLVILGLHCSDSNEIPWNIERRAYYAPLPFLGYPTWLVDGYLDSWSGDPPWSVWDDDVDARLLVPTDVTIELSATEGDTPDIWDVTAAVCIEPGGVGKTMRIYLAEVLDNFPVPAHFTRNGLRQVATTEDIVLAPDECTDVMRTFTLDATSMAAMGDVSFVGWAQEALAAGPADVFQASQLNPTEVFNDGFESGDTSVWGPMTP